MLYYIQQQYIITVYEIKGVSFSYLMQDIPDDEGVVGPWNMSSLYRRLV